MLDNADKKLDKVDSALTKIGNILKKHWGKLLLLLLAYFVWWFVGEVQKEMENPTEETYYEEYDEGWVAEDTVNYPTEDEYYEDEE